MSQDPFSVPGIPSVNMEGSKAQRIANERAAQNSQVSQEESQQSLQSFIDEGAFSPSLMSRRFQTLEMRRRQIWKKEEEERIERKEEKIVDVELTQKTAEEFYQKNKELDPRALLLLHARIQPESTPEEILQKVLELYPDPWLADEALAFLEQTSQGAIKEQVKFAREAFYKRHDREIRAGRNTQLQTQTFGDQGIGTPPSLRQLYKEITTNPRDAYSLFQDFAELLDFDKLKIMVAFLLHALGSDLKSKGPSIARGELYVLFTEARKLQAILGVFYFFKGRMGLMSSAFQKQGITLTLSFEELAKQLMKLVQEKYPSVDRVLSLASQLRASDDILAQIILFTQMRDAMRHIAPRLFRSNQHRQDLLNALMDALEELEEELDEEEDA
ncbi:MAG: negative regulator of type secretion [Chlamydiota bacterium]